MIRINYELKKNVAEKKRNEEGKRLLELKCRLLFLKKNNLKI